MLKIGTIIGGYLKGSQIYKLNDNCIGVFWNDTFVIEINNSSIESCQNINTNQKKSLPLSLAGDIIFGTAGVLAMGNKQTYTIEITWINKEKSLIQINSASAYNYFIAKTYDNGKNKYFTTNYGLDKPPIIQTINSCEKYIQETHKKICNDLLNPRNTYTLMFLIPYYKAQYENNFSMLDTYKKYEKEYKIVAEILRKKLNSILIEVMSQLDLFNYYEKLKKCENDPVKKNLLMKFRPDLDENKIKKELKSEYIKMFNQIKQENKKEIIEPTLEKKLIISKFYSLAKQIHEENGYIYFAKDKESQYIQLKKYCNNMSPLLYQNLEKIIDQTVTEEDIPYLYLVDVRDIFGKFPTHYRLSAIVNCYFGKNYFNQANTENNKTNNTNFNKYDELKKLKELLDIEAITQEEFEQEKAKILNNN